MNKHLFLIILLFVIIFSGIFLYMMTHNNGETMTNMSSFFETNVLSDIKCFNDCMAQCVVEKVPEQSEDQKVTCEQSCGMECADNEPVFRF